MTRRMADVYKLAAGGSAVGTGLNTLPDFGPKIAAEVVMRTGHPFVTAPTTFAAQGSLEAMVNASACAAARRGVLGPWAETHFAVGLFGASLLAAAVLPLSTAFAVCEVFGCERGVDKSFAAAPVFNGIFTGLAALSAAVAIVVPAHAIVPVLIRLQIINGVVLALELLFVLRLVNNRSLLGRDTNISLRSTRSALSIFNRVD